MILITDKVIFFSNGKDASIYLDEHLTEKDKIPDLILLDMNMPIMDGWEFMKFFSSIKPSIPKNITVYMVTSSVNEDDRRLAESLPDISGYILKPSSLEDLETLIHLPTL